MTRLVRTSYHTSRKLPELTAYYSLSPVALISGKVFLQESASRSYILHGGKMGSPGSAPGSSALQADDFTRLTYFPE